MKKRDWPRERTVPVNSWNPPGRPGDLPQGEAARRAKGAAASVAWMNMSDSHAGVASPESFGDVLVQRPRAAAELGETPAK
jgi:hypothetical protein